MVTILKEKNKCQRPTKAIFQAGCSKFHIVHHAVGFVSGDTDAATQPRSKHGFDRWSQATQMKTYIYFIENI
jgi:hypothetical protein